jgi:RNA polymerase sigma-70 factor (ECF subfamily)
MDESPRYEQFVRLLTRHEPSVRAYIRAGVSAWNDVDEVMQEVSLVAWRKFESLDSPEGFPHWLRIIAKYEVLKHRRSQARDRLVLDEDIVATLLDEGLADSASEDAHRGDERTALERCLEKLPAARRELVLKAYSPERPIQALADQLGKSPAAMYQLLSRIRSELADCVERTRAVEGGAS